MTVSELACMHPMVYYPVVFVCAGVRRCSTDASCAASILASQCPAVHLPSPQEQDLLVPSMLPNQALSKLLTMHEFKRGASGR